MVGLPKIYGMFDPLSVVVANGANKSDRIVIGRSTISGFYITGYVGKIYINASPMLTLDDSIFLSSPQINRPQLVIGMTFPQDELNPLYKTYHQTQAFKDPLGARYFEEISISTGVYVTVDYTLFLGPIAIEFELENASVGETLIIITPYQMN